MWTYRFLWWQVSFEAKYATRSDYYWCSTGFHGKEDVITWQGDLSQLQRVHHIWVDWAYAPGKFKVQLSKDKDRRDWQDKGDWRGFKFFDVYFNNAGVPFVAKPIEAARLYTVVQTALDAAYDREAAAATAAA